MTAEFTAFLTAIAFLITAITSAAGLLIGIYNSRKIEQVHVATNSKMDKLLAVTSEAAEAKGVLQGKQELKDQQAKG